MTNSRMKAWLTRDPGGLSTELAAARGGHSTRKFADILGPGWSSSKISKLENGEQLITGPDLDAWANATNATQATRKRWLAMLSEAEIKRAQFRRHGGASPTVQRNEGLEGDAAYIRVYAPDLIPDLLQTDGYAAEVARLAGTELDRVSLHHRQRALTDTDRDLRFLLGEAVLRTVLGETSVMAAQLDRLVSASAMSNVQIAVLPLASPLAALPLPGPVTILDEDAVIDDGVKARHYSGAEAAGVGVRLDRLWAAALHGDGARERILAAVANLPPA